jgi:hypothetical protein
MRCRHYLQLMVSRWSMTNYMCLIYLTMGLVTAWQYLCAPDFTVYYYNVCKYFSVIIIKETAYAMKS